MNTPRRLLVLPLIAAGALLVAACGDDTTQQPATPVTTDAQMTETTDAMMTETTDAQMTETTDAMMTETTDAMMTETTGG